MQIIYQELKKFHTISNGVAKFLFFQSSFNAFYLNFFSSFGYLGLLFLKTFFFSIFILDLFLFLFKKIKLQKNRLNKFLLIFLYINIFYYLIFVSNLRWSIFGNQTILIFAVFIFYLKVFFK